MKEKFNALWLGSFCWKPTREDSGIELGCLNEFFLIKKD